MFFWGSSFGEKLFLLCNCSFFDVNGPLLSFLGSFLFNFWGDGNKNTLFLLWGKIVGPLSLFSFLK